MTSPSDRAREIQLLTEGAMVMILIHGDRSYADAAARAAKRLVSHAGLLILSESVATKPTDGAMVTKSD